MKRPYLVNFLAIETEEQISIKTMVALGNSSVDHKEELLDLKLKAKPWQSFNLLTADEFELKIIGLDNKNEQVFSKKYESDIYGNFNIRFPLTANNNKITHIIVYEIAHLKGVELLLGSFIPQKINDPKKLIIADFDKTLVDTKYSTMKELYISIKNPVDYFPKVQKSIDLIIGHIKQGYQPFILSASPHFYENAIRDWLYQHHIYTSNIFLKDYRKVFSILGRDLKLKDLKTQGFYKLNHLVNLLLMTGIPKELILMGDGFESDTIIYLTLMAILKDKEDPWHVWNNIKKLDSFNLNTKQNTRFLSKVYQLSNLVKKENSPTSIKIHIRCKKDNIEMAKARDFKFPFLTKNIHEVNFYIA
ncbi:MAG: hypothetical protein ACI9QD_000804 [Thermoproteota archaeon]|jgi:hypothetical protein